MLLLSPGDDSASLPIHSLKAQPERVSDCQSGAECDQAPPTASTLKTVSKTIEGDRDAASVYTSTTFAAAKVGDRTALLPSVLVQSSHSQGSLAKDLYPPETELDGLYALRQAARLRTLRQTRASSWHRVTSAALPESTGSSALDSYAAPLSPLRERDITALAALFQRDDIYAIEADVNHRLLALLPEPCWEEDVFAFLQEFLAER